MRWLIILAGLALLSGMRDALAQTASVGPTLRTRVQSAGTPLTMRPTVNFAGTTTCVDNAGANRTDCTSTGGGGGGTWVTGTVSMGATPAVGTTTSRVVIAATGMTSTTPVSCSVSHGTADHPETVGGQPNDDAAMEEITVAGWSRGTNTITVTVHAPRKTYGGWIVYCIY